MALVLLSMKLQRQQGRKYKGKTYDKWVVVIPKEDIEKLGWSEGEELEGKYIGGLGYFLVPKKIIKE